MNNQDEVPVGPPDSLEYLLDHSDLKQLITLARITRSAFERLAIKEGFPKDLRGKCYDATCFLRRLAKAHGIDTEMGEGKGHYFVLYNGNIVIDVTSTQFGQPMPVVVLPLVEAAKRGSWWKLWGRSRPLTFSRPIDVALDMEMDATVGFGVGEGEL